MMETGDLSHKIKNSDAVLIFCSGQGSLDGGMLNSITAVVTITSAQ